VAPLHNIVMLLRHGRLLDADQLELVVVLGNRAPALLCAAQNSDFVARVRSIATKSRLGRQVVAHRFNLQPLRCTIQASPLRMTAWSA